MQTNFYFDVKNSLPYNKLYQNGTPVAHDMGNIFCVNENSLEIGNLNLNSKFK